jgi:hypothetical protein
LGILGSLAGGFDEEDALLAGAEDPGLLLVNPLPFDPSCFAVAGELAVGWLLGEAVLLGIGY